MTIEDTEQKYSKQKDTHKFERRYVYNKVLFNIDFDWIETASFSIPY